MNCCDCGNEIKPSLDGGIGVGYGHDTLNHTICYSCCAERDIKSMRESGKAVLYLIQPDYPTRNNMRLTNWPGTLKIHVYHSKKGKHNIAGTRIDVWFNFEGQSWHGVQYGENTQILHCKRIKA